MNALTELKVNLEHGYKMGALDADCSLPQTAEARKALQTYLSQVGKLEAQLSVSDQVYVTAARAALTQIQSQADTACGQAGTLEARTKAAASAVRSIEALLNNNYSALKSAACIAKSAQAGSAPGSANPAQAGNAAKPGEAQTGGSKTSGGSAGSAQPGH